MSRNLLKGGYIVVSEQEPVTIDGNEAVARRLEELAKSMESEIATEEDEAGFCEGIDPTMVAKLVDDPEDISALTIEREKILAQAEENAREEAQHILEEAQESAKKILEEANEKGYQDGYEQGLAKATGECEAKYSNRIAQVEQKEKALEEEYQKKMSEMEPCLIDKLTQIYTHITGIRLEDDREAIQFILNHAMQALENGRNYIIHVSKEDYSYVKENLEQIVEGTGLLKETFEIVEDVTLGRADCLIESEAGIWDCGLGTQMELLQKQLRILSYEPE